MEKGVLKRLGKMVEQRGRWNGGINEGAAGGRGGRVGSERDMLICAGFLAAPVSIA